MLEYFSRFFLRLHPSIMKQINEVGLERYFSLAIVVVATCPNNCVEDSLKEFVLLIDHCTMDRFDYNKQKLLLSGERASMF